MTQDLYFKMANGTILTGKAFPNGNELNLEVPFILKDEVKNSFSAPRWIKPFWVVKNDERAKVTLDFLQGGNPFELYDQDLFPYEGPKDLFSSQVEIIRHIITRKCCIVAAEMGMGKTRAAMEAMIWLNKNHAITRGWFVAPKSALESVKFEWRKWNPPITPQFMTYEEMVRILKNWDSNIPVPQIIVFDEASRLKNDAAQRSQSASHLAVHVRKIGGYVVLMSGSPAPKSPADWWSLCEIAYPGFLKEGGINKFKDRIALIRYEENQSGIKYPKLITYRDSDKKCNVCGKFQDHIIHESDDFSKMVVQPGTAPDQQPHDFVPMVDEVSLLSKRLQGISLVQFKKDYLDLPEKIYQRVECKPSAQTLRLAKMIKKSAPSAAQALIDLRTLSDGFQYTERLTGTTKCEKCDGKKKILLEGVEHSCIHCSGNGVIKQYERFTAECETPKTEALNNYLDLKEEDGRLVVFAGFTASIDRVCNLVVKAGWDFIKVDGRGWHSSLGTSDPQQLLALFADRENGKKICFVGHPGSAGMGLTLVASDTIIYYSNDFNAESRIQSEARIHRIGSRGANIIDLVHLPVDALVLDNLTKKQDMMAVTMGMIDRCFDETE